MAPHPVPVTRFTVETHNLYRGFNGRTILAGLDLTIRRGEFVALLGRSGSGKSTFLKALAELDHDVTGSGRLDVPQNRSVVFQDARLLPWRTVLQNVTLGLRHADDAGRRMLREVGLAGREASWPVELSGGEQQRVALARSLVREPELLLADEPFGALDALTRIRMHVLLKELCARHQPSVLLVTHDVDEAIALADRILVLEDGAFVEDLAIDLPSPREPDNPRFGQLRRHLLGKLGVATH
ncbi:ABC transporter ATP-binding protein [Paracoccus sp. S3-43]|uniref:ABC transporter ATP-binding protein n=1 Tax=Paracoccus sp. S3-43 TaxID=3030011 RepID=UPI0023B1E85B|nr:ABC transporter ATP-binding protein [Paracoccus sp. S3-43]WEF25594.1 ABC transporter ATP-binding protein [Paracoccus sp. S3-43]